MSAFQTQVGGNHYSNLKIQPMQYSMANKLDACQHSIIKYVTRFRDKNGLADLQKARHVLDMLIELEYPNTKECKPQLDDGWIEWNGGKCPVDSETPVCIRVRKGEEYKNGLPASAWSWRREGSPYDIIAYRVVK